MAPTIPDTHHQILLAKRPVGLPDDGTFATRDGPVPTPEAGQVLVRVEMVSLDPAMRGWLNDRPSYVPPVQLGAVMRALGIGTVVSSTVPAWSVGDRVSGSVGWQEYAVLPANELQPVPHDVPIELAMGPLGMTGMTAYFGLLEVGTPSEGETVLVSGAAGAVGSIVGQIAKIKGCRVVGIAGGPDKCGWLVDTLGFDAAIDYKNESNLRAALGTACPDGVDVYFDNVGGPLLDLALERINRKARIVICGAISTYNATSRPPGPANYLALLVQRARMEGFVVFDYTRRYPEAAAQIAEWISQGRIEARHHVVEGLDNAPSALLKLFDGSNQGKLMVRVAPSSTE